MLAIGLVLVSPVLAWGLQQRSLLGPPGSAVAVDRWLVMPVSALSMGAGLIHVAVIGDHIAEDAVVGSFFVVASVFQIGWAIRFAVRPQRGVAALGLAVNAGIVVVWVITRTIGLPFGTHPSVAEPMGIPDLFATTAELLIVAGMAVVAFPPWRVAATRVRLPVASADLAVVMALIAIALATSFALADVAINGGHTLAGS